jgi:ABC-type multidrug transport system fused ATPase/permease subunit
LPGNGEKDWSNGWVEADMSDTTKERPNWFARLRAVWSLLERRDRRRFMGLLVLMVFSAVGQMVTISLVVPFLGLALNPSYIQSNHRLHSVYLALQMHSNEQFLFWIGVGIIAAILLTNAATMLVLAGNNYLVWSLNRRLSTRLLRLYLQQPYAFFARRNTSEMAVNVLVEIQNLASATILPVLEILSRAFTVLLVLGLLLVVDPLVTVIAGVAFGLIYTLEFRFTQRRLQWTGRERLRLQEQRFGLATEAFGSIKEVRILQREHHILEAYDAATRTFSRCNAEQVVLGQSPRLVIESLAFGAIVGVVLLMLHQGREIATLIPKLSMFALAGYRLIPALQQMFASLAQMQGNEAVVTHLSNDLRLPPDPSFKPGCLDPAPALRFSQMVELDAVTFGYETRSRPVIRDVSLRIAKGEMVAFCGATGSGKTTLADLLMGLLRPAKGVIRIDGSELNDENIRNWQANFGYVPQQIFLVAGDIYRNVAFGLPPEKIDRDRVQAACRLACIHDFIVGELPQGYETEAGDRGIRLSGGQRQRIGLARALYHDPQILVLDEATSALDNETERYVMEAIQSVAATRTLIIVAHRLSTVQRCHRIFYLRDGSVEGAGSYEEVLKSCDAFRRMAMNENTTEALVS